MFIFTDVYILYILHSVSILILLCFYYTIHIKVKFLKYLDFIDIIDLTYL